uniref:Putative zinc finger-domain protein n=1 Tax=Trypanosoma congolense (strain IL3000) TaxID=1068625 RepID=G0UP71_TRYCI|nr:putative zinc finger-domain protein [Trypanosoma congolense IL3000]
MPCTLGGHLLLTPSFRHCYSITPSCSSGISPVSGVYVHVYLSSVVMSFTVHPGSSPVSRSYNSPQMLLQSPQSHTALPFSLSGADESLSTNTSSRKGGTDPTRYKTTICRNWEMGTCTFKGCAFAHGEEELRLPARAGSYKSPLMGGGHRPSPGKTPPLYPARASTPPAGTYQIEQLLKMLYVEVTQERKLVAVHTEANRSLEALLKNEQARCGDAHLKLELAKANVERLRRIIHEASAGLHALLESHDAIEEQRRRLAAITQKMISTCSTVDTAADARDGEETRVIELLSVLQCCQNSGNM